MGLFKTADRDTSMAFRIVILFVLVSSVNADAVEKKHRDEWRWRWDDYEYERCPYSDYCRNYYDQCSSTEGYQVRCNKCSYFQTCVTDTNNIMDSCDDTYICKDIDAFKQGKGAFAVMFVMIFLLVVLSIISICLCIGYRKLGQKLQKANNMPVRNAVVPSYPVKYIYNPTREKDLNSPPPPYRESEASAPPPTSSFLASHYRNHPPTDTAVTNEVNAGRKEWNELRVDLTK